MSKHRGRRIPPSPAYVAPLLDLGHKLAERGPAVYHISVEHDDWCDGWQSGDFSRCNCNPTVAPMAGPPAEGGRR